jgi:glucosamine--fructose-6-phosphate aminotransferase (isomerizing)
MSGIVGYIGGRNAVQTVIEGLTIMERLGLGYDSAGVAIISGQRIRIKKRVGTVNNLAQRLPKSFRSKLAIAHTRWATYGKPSEANAHPLSDCEGSLAVVHTGLIVNFEELKARLQEEGHRFQSETDSEIISHLIERSYSGNLEKAVREALLQVEGTYAIAVIHRDHPGQIVGAASGSSLIMGIGEDEVFLASDVQVLAPYRLKIYYLRDQELVSLTRSSFEIAHLSLPHGKAHLEDQLPEAAEGADLGDYTSFFEKEMYDQPGALRRAFSGRMLKDYGMVRLQGLDPIRKKLFHLKRVLFTGIGSSYAAGMVGASFLETLARIPANYTPAGELANSNPTIEEDTLYVIISQSGETAVSIAAMREAVLRGGTVIGICNRIASTIYRETGAGIYLRAGIEFAVPATKTFTVELVAVAMLTIMLGRQRHISAAQGKKYLGQLEQLPELVQGLFAQRAKYAQLARQLNRMRQFIFLGYGPLFGIARASALKIWEMLNLPAAGFTTGEINYGPIAMVDNQTLIVMFIPNDLYLEKNKQIYTRLLTRNTHLLVITDLDPREFSQADAVLSIPAAGIMGTPVVTMTVIQLLVLELARLRRRDLDRPRHLQKVINVE